MTHDPEPDTAAPEEYYDIPEPHEHPGCDDPSPYWSPND